MGEAFRAAVSSLDHDIPLIRFKAGQRKLDVVRPYLDRAENPGVVAIGVAQEVQRITMGTDVSRTEAGVPKYEFRRVDRHQYCSSRGRIEFFFTL